MASEILQKLKTAITWRSTGGTELLTGTSLASGSGRQGAYHDFGTAALARRGKLRVFLKPGATRVVGELIGIYWLSGDGTHYDNDDGTGDIAVSSIDKLRNPTFLGYIEIDENAAVDMSIVIPDFLVPERYGAPLLWNYTANSLSATATDFGADFEPMADENQ